MPKPKTEDLKHPGPPASRFTPGLIEQLLHLLFPDRCLACSQILPVLDGMPICSSCRPMFSYAGPICPRCERIVKKLDKCSCPVDSFPLHSLFALLWYEKQWRHLLHDLKYRKHRSLARPLGSWLGMEIYRRNYCSPHLVAPVPLHKKRAKERGFNQSALVARYAAKALNVPCREMLVKEKETFSQVTISRRERYANIKGAFRAVSPLPQNTVVLLIDDIYSTGATMKEAAGVLQDCGARVYGAVLAYNPLRR